MPRFDGSGPMGMGPLTGQGRGYCRPRGFIGRMMGYGARARAGADYGYGNRAAYGRGRGRNILRGNYPRP